LARAAAIARCACSIDTCMGRPPYSSAFTRL
jgi:hypothetical protein